MKMPRMEIPQKQEELSEKENFESIEKKDKDNVRENFLELLYKDVGEADFYMRKDNFSTGLETILSLAYKKPCPFRIDPEKKEILTNRANQLLSSLRNSADEYAFSGKTCVEYLDISSEENCERTSRLITDIEEYMASILMNEGNISNEGIYSSSGKPWSDDFNKFIENFTKKLDKAENNYFYNTYCNFLIRAENIKYIYRELSQVYQPFNITKDRSAVDVYGDLYIIDSQISIEDLLSKQKPTTRIIEINDTEMEYSGIDEESCIISNSLGVLEPSNFISGDKNLSREQFISIKKEYEELMSTSLRLAFEKDFNINLIDLSIAEQFRFMSFLKSRTVGDIEEAKIFVKKYGISSIKTFLSIEHGGKEMGDKILELGEKLPEDVASKIFEKYGKIIDTALSARETIEKLVPKEQYKSSIDILSKIEESLVIRAKNLLIQFSENTEINIADISEQLNRHNESILLFADTYKAFIEDGQKIDLETVLTTSIRVLSKDDKISLGDNLWQVTRDNRKKFITKDDEMKKREDRFRETLKDENTSFYVLEHDGHVLAFCSFEKQTDGTILAESLNVETEIKGAKVGGEFFKVLVGKVRKKGDIVGYVHEGNVGTLPFYENIGFVTQKVVKDNQDFYKITLPKK